MGGVNLIKVNQRDLVLAIGSVTGMCSSDVIRVENVADDDVAFKMKTTNRDRYAVRPNVSCIPKGEHCDIRIFLAANIPQPLPGPSKDRFQLRVTLAPGLSESNNAAEFWRDKVNENDDPEIVRLKFFLRFIPHVFRDAASETPAALRFYRRHFRLTRRLLRVRRAIISMASGKNLITVNNRDFVTGAEGGPAKGSGDVIQLENDADHDATFKKKTTNTNRSCIGRAPASISSNLIEVNKRSLVIVVEDGGGDIIRVENVADGDVAFKMMTTNPSRYIVRPNVSCIPKGEHCDICIFLAERPVPGPSKDRFQLCVALAPDISESNNAADFWHDSENALSVQRLKFFVVWNDTCGSETSAASPEFTVW